LAPFIPEIAGYDTTYIEVFFPILFVLAWRLDCQCY